MSEVVKMCKRALRFYGSTGWDIAGVTKCIVCGKELVVGSYEAKRTAHGFVCRKHKE